MDHFFISRLYRHRPAGPSISNVGVKNISAAGQARFHRNDKIVFFMHIHNSCTRDDDHLIFLIKTDDAHKGRILPPTTINTFKRW